MSDINRPATLDEIAKAIGKDKSSFTRLANKENWKYTEEKSKGRHNKRLYDLKDLPKDIQFAVLRKRLDDDLITEQSEQQSAEFNTTATDINPGNNGGVFPDRANDEPVPDALDVGNDGGRKIIRDDEPGQSSGQQLRAESLARPATTADIRFGDAGQLGRPVVADGKGLVGDQSMDGGIAHRDSERDPSQYNKEQRAIGQAIGIVMRWIDRYPGFENAALLDLNRNYKTGSGSSAYCT